MASGLWGFCSAIGRRIRAGRTSHSSDAVQACSAERRQCTRPSQRSSQSSEGITIDAHELQNSLGNSPYVTAVSACRSCRADSARGDGGAPGPGQAH